MPETVRLARQWLYLRLLTLNLARLLRRVAAVAAIVAAPGVPLAEKRAAAARAIGLTR